MNKKKRILLVDDEIIIRKTLSHDLSQEAYQVLTATSGEEAIERIQKGTKVDLIITDLLMSGVDGFGVLKASKKADPFRPVLILTGFGDMSFAVDALRLGADDFITKPYDPDELYFRVAKALEKHEILKKLQFYEECLPICSFCKKIREVDRENLDHGTWVSVEDFLAKKTEIQFSHGICDSCLKKHYPEFIDE